MLQTKKDLWCTYSGWTHHSKKYSLHRHLSLVKGSGGILTLKEQHWNFYVICLVFILLTSSPFSAKSFANGNEPLIRIYDEFSYETHYNLTTGYIEKPNSHKLLLDADGLSEGTHNLTIVLHTKEAIRSIDAYYVNGEIQNQSDSEKNYVTAIFNGTGCEFYLFLTEVDSLNDPLDFLIVPSDTDLFSLENDGRLIFDAWLNASRKISSVSVKISSTTRPSPEIEEFVVKADLDVDQRFRSRDAVYFTNVSSGSHYLEFEVVYNGLRGNFHLSADAREIDYFSCPIDCYLDGMVTPFTKNSVSQYSTHSVDFLNSVVPGVFGYTDPEYFTLNYTAPDTLALRIDAMSREKIEFFLLDSEIEDISIEPAEVYGNPCYQMNFKLKSYSRNSLGLMIYDKLWFLRPSTVHLEEIPIHIRETYTSPSSSFDGIYIDVNNPTVQSWAKQVVGNETNPYLVANLIFQNLTHTWTYSKEYEQCRFFDEFASSTLANRKGVCRHFARAFAALCMVNKLPVRTIVGTGFNLRNNTWKKNHEWNEVYFPSYGWVTVDPTWGEFGLLSGGHALCTLWRYIEGTFNVTKTSEEFRIEAKNETKRTLWTLINICNDKASNLGVHSEEYDRLFEQARMSAEQGYIHEALLAVSRMYLLSSEAKGLVAQQVLQTILVGVGLIVIVITASIFYVARVRKRNMQVRQRR
jgi:transglutaminase-like putative cysteine protease